MSDSEPIFIWKFIIGAKPVEDPDNSAITYDHCVAVALAATEEEARARLLETAQLNGAPSNWLKVAQVVKLSLVRGTVVTWLA